MTCTRSFSVLAALAVVAASTPVTAQEQSEEATGSPQSAEEAAAAEVVEEIVVTAAKREQSLQDVHIPVAAMSGEALERSQIGSLEDLQFRLPNITFGNDFNFAKLFIRGLGFNASFHGIDSSVAVHVDGAVVSQVSAQFASMFDLERVEVLRGPQGTLYGRNNTGGTVNLITRKPADHVEGYLRMAVGGPDLNLIPEAAVSLPLSDTVRSRFSFRFQDRAGYGENEATGEDIDDAKVFAGRGQLHFLPSDQFHFLVTGEYFKEDDAAGAVKFLAPSFPDNPPGFTALGLVFGGLAEEPRNLRARPGFGPSNFKETWYLTGTANLEASDTVTLKSITNYRELTTILFHDFTMSDAFEHAALPYAPGQTSAIHDLEVRQSQFSEELQLIVESDRAHAVLGGFYLEEDVRGDNRIGHDPFNIDDDRLMRVKLDGDLEVKAYAAFANLSFDVSEKVSLRAAGRYSHEERDIVNEFRVAPPFSPMNLPSAAPPQPNTEENPFDFASETWDDFSPEVGIDFRPDDDVHLYFTYAEGFKSGAAELGNTSPVFVDPEDVRNFEVGLKSTLAQNRAQLNVAAFYYELDNAQFNLTVPIPVPPFFVTSLENAAKQEGKGLEVDLRWRASDRFELDLAATFLDSEFTEFEAVNPIDPLVPVTPDPTTIPESDLSGNEPRNSPKFQFNALASYHHPFDSGARLTVAGSIAYKGRQFYTEFNDPRMGADAYAILDANVRFTPARGNWVLDVWGKNLADELIVAGAFAISTSRTISGTYLPPRRFGATVSYFFD